MYSCVIGVEVKSYFKLACAPKKQGRKRKKIIFTDNCGSLTSATNRALGSGHLLKKHGADDFFIESKRDTHGKVVKTRLSAKKPY